MLQIRAGDWPSISAMRQSRENLPSASIVIAACRTADKNLAPARRFARPLSVVRSANGHVADFRLARGGLKIELIERRQRRLNHSFGRDRLVHESHSDHSRTRFR